MENNLNLSLKVGRYAIALKDGVRINSGIRYFIERIGEYGSASKVIVNGAENDSSIFAEDYEQPLMKRALLKVKSCNSARLIARFSAPKELKLLLGGHSEITITKERLASLKVADVLTIGRDSDCDIKSVRYGEFEEDFPFPSCVSRMHCFIYRERESLYRIFDGSSFGTELVL